MRSTVTDYSQFTFLALFTHLFAPSPALRAPSPNRERENKIFASLEQKEKLFEDDSESRAGACPENDFSFGDVICAQHCKGLFTIHYSLFTLIGISFLMFLSYNKNKKIGKSRGIINE